MKILIAGGGIGAITFDINDIPSEAVAPGPVAVPMVQSAFSSISGNTVNATANDDEFFGAIGGGVAVGSTYLDGPPPLIAALEYGKYTGILSGNSGNTVTVTGANDGELEGLAGGGGLASPVQFTFGSKPEFAIRLLP